MPLSPVQVLPLQANHTPGFSAAPPHLMSLYSTASKDRSVFTARPFSVSDDGNLTREHSQTRKASISLISPPDDYHEETSCVGSNPLSASVQKRQGYIAASARFRLKKKEREAALERDTKELEMRVRGLERECEEFRRVNGWLRELVVGVTDAARGPAVVTPAIVGIPAAGLRRRSDTPDYY